MVQITLPLNVPTGEVELVVVVVPKADRKHSGKELLESEIFGMWADRLDIKDSAEHAKELREKAWKRPA
jgi:hypothetical protein